jgi:energy-coupling factor transport system ATP-binding protein
MGIQFQKVNYAYKTYKESFKALIDIDLDIKAKGEIIGICGHTGSGKSTLVQHMNGLIEASVGKTVIFDMEIPSRGFKKKNTLRQKVGLVFQFPEYQLFEETIIKDIMFGPMNMNYGLEKSKALAISSAKRVGIDSSMFELSPFRISGGQMRRVAIAGILAMEPDILVLDEPTRGLDPVGQRDLMEHIYTLHQDTQKTVIIISHDMDLIAQYATRVIVMKDARVAFDGSKDDLFSHKDFHTFYLDLPETVKMMKHLTQNVGIPYKLVYSKEALMSYLVEVSHE